MTLSGIFLSAFLFRLLCLLFLCAVCVVNASKASAPSAQCDQSVRFENLVGECHGLTGDEEFAVFHTPDIRVDTYTQHDKTQTHIRTVHPLPVGSDILFPTAHASAHADIFFEN